MPAPVGIVRQWCQSLGVLSAVSITRHEAELKLAAYVPLLADRFPAAAFTQDSLEHVAFQARKGFPTYSELAEWLSQWWREHRAPPPQLTVEQSTAMAEVRERHRAITDSWDDPRGIQQRVRDCQGNVLWLRVLAKAVRSWAPQHLGYIPPHILAQLDHEWVPEHRQEQLAPAAPRHLTPEQLDTVSPLPGGQKRATTSTIPPQQSGNRDANPSTPMEGPDHNTC